MVAPMGDELDDCNHDWETKNPVTRVCCVCDAIEHDPRPSVLITVIQASSLGFARHPIGLLYAKEWTFGEEAFQGAGGR